MNEPLRLVPQGVETRRGWHHLTWLVHAPGEEPAEFFYALPESQAHLFADPEQGDPAVVSTLLYAMEQARDVIVEAPVCPRLLDGLEKVQQIWARWRPYRYSPVRLIAREERSLESPGDGATAVCAYSGGVDACYTLFRHLAGAAGRLNRNPKAALFVHGMDIPLDQEDVYERVADQAERLLAGCGVELLRMRISSRRFHQSWEDSFGLQLAGAFMTLQGTYSHALHGSEEPYESLVFPWGSTPLTDPLCSAAAMRIEHDGSEMDRTEKVRWLALNTDACDSLRVCWEGPAKDRNCGVCEKCIRTMLNFWATGLEPPRVFPHPLTPRLVGTVKPRNRIQHAYLEEIHRHARATYPDDDPILRVLSRGLAHAGWRAWVRRAANIGRHLLRV